MAAINSVISASVRFFGFGGPEAVRSPRTAWTRWRGAGTVGISMVAIVSSMRARWLVGRKRLVEQQRVLVKLQLVAVAFAAPALCCCSGCYPRT